MSARSSQKNYLPWAKPDIVGNKENSSSIFDRNPENILKRQEKAQLLKNLRRSFAIKASGRIHSKETPGWSERKVTNSSLFQRPNRPKPIPYNSSPINTEQNALSRRSKVLQELNIPTEKTPKAMIGPITSLSSRKRNLTYTVDQKKSLSNLKFEQESKRSLNFNQQTIVGEHNFKGQYFIDNSLANHCKENFTQRLTSFDLSNTNAEESMLRATLDGNGDILKHSNSDRYIKPVAADVKTSYLEKYQKCNEHCEGNKSRVKIFSSQLPVLKQSSKATATANSLTSSKIIKETNINKPLFARRSMSALSSLRRNTNSSSAIGEFQKHSFSQNDDVFSDLERNTSCADFAIIAKPSTASIIVTKPSLSSDEKDSYIINNHDRTIEIEKEIDSSPNNFQKSSKLQSETKNSNEAVINSFLTQNNVDKVSCTQQDLPLNIENLRVLDCIKQGDAAYCDGSSVVNIAQAHSLDQDISVKSLQDILQKISRERKQINVAMEEISILVQMKTKAIIESYESSIEPLENMVKLQLEKLSTDNKISKADESSNVASCEAVTTLNETCIKLTDYTFLGTPMPTKKKRLARSLSHPQALTESHSLKNRKQHSIAKLNTSDEKNSSYSAEELSPFTNLVGDCERASLAPMTPKTRHNLFNLKENLNQQLDLLFD